MIQSRLEERVDDHGRHSLLEWLTGTHNTRACSLSKKSEDAFLVGKFGSPILMEALCSFCDGMFTGQGVIDGYERPVGSVEQRAGGIAKWTAGLFAYSPWY